MYDLQLSLLTNFAFCMAWNKLILQRKLNRLDLDSGTTLTCRAQAHVVTLNSGTPGREECWLKCRTPFEDTPRSFVIYGQVPAIVLERSAKDDRTIWSRDDVCRFARLLIVCCETESVEPSLKCRSCLLAHVISDTHSLTCGAYTIVVCPRMG